METDEFDWEAELALVVGTQVRRATTSEAEEAIAGFTILNDITCRDWQFRTREWLQGKNWESTTPVGPTSSRRTRSAVSGRRWRCAATSTPPRCRRTTPGTCCSTRSRPGDIIATGTPGGVGHARRPPVYLTGGETVVTEIESLGRLENRVVVDRR